MEQTPVTGIPILGIADLIPGATSFCMRQITIPTGSATPTSGQAAIDWPFSSMHRPAFFCLLFLMEGSGEVQLEEKKIGLKPGHVLLTMPLMISSVQLQPKSNVVLICFTESFFSLRYNSNVLRQFAFFRKQQPCHFQVAGADLHKWHALIDFMQVEYRLDIPAKNTLRSYLNILLCEVERADSADESTVERSLVAQKVAKFISLVDAHYLQHKNPSFYASALHISPSYLNKLCKTHQFLTSGQIIKKRVLLEAKRLLVYSADSIAEIAYALGFENPSYFHTYFKKNTGTTPERYRKQT